MNMTNLCQELHNWFEVEKYFGSFEITDGKISLPSLKPNQYFRIVGSIFNDGVHKNDAELNLIDEEFKGAVWSMGVPPAVVELLDEINRWIEQYGTSVMSPYSSESFGGYSYTKASGRTTPNGGSSTMTYRDVFSEQLNRWRKV